MIGRNQELYDDMIASGHEFFQKGDDEYFVFGDRYAKYPIGYIRGPWYQKNPAPHYLIRVQTQHGWLTIKGKTHEEAENLAIRKQIEILGS